MRARACVCENSKRIFFFFFFFEIGIFFFKLGKKSPKSHWERGRISAPEDTKKKFLGDETFYGLYFFLYLSNLLAHRGEW